MRFSMTFGYASDTSKLSHRYNICMTRIISCMTKTRIDANLNLESLERSDHLLENYASL